MGTRTSSQTYLMAYEPAYQIETKDDSRIKESVSEEEENRRCQGTEYGSTARAGLRLMTLDSLAVKGGI